MFEVVRSAHKTICDCQLMLEGDMGSTGGHLLTFKVCARGATLFELDRDRSGPFEIRSNIFEVNQTHARTCDEQMRKFSEHFHSLMYEAVLSTVLSQAFTYNCKESRISRGCSDAALFCF